MVAARSMKKEEVFAELGLEQHNPGVFAGRWLQGTEGELAVYNPATGEILATSVRHPGSEYDQVVESSVSAFASWRMLPAPKRGEYVRQLGHALREHKEALGALVSLEMGKIRAEGEGEVQEMIDICDFAVGLSPPALRPDDGLRAPPPPDVRAVASARPGRGHHRLQLPGGGVVLELRPSPRFAATRSSGSPRRRLR